MQINKAFFSDRFLESYAGPSLLGDPKVALVELIANCWDAGATEVEVTWPEPGANGPFKVIDNGHGMTAEEFEKRWLTLAYNRLEMQGKFVQFPPDVALPIRKAYGRNGIGRYAAFCFGYEYLVRTWKDGKAYQYKVTRGSEFPVVLDRISEEDKNGHGTEILVERTYPIRLTEESARAEIGMRFLTDPDFVVVVGSKHVQFADIPEEHLEEVALDIEDLGTIRIVVVDTKITDRTSQLHGIAWHVNGRLVGECSWRDSGHEAFLDGRTAEAKRYTFIIYADCLAEYVLPDWSGFSKGSTIMEEVNEQVQGKIHELLVSYTSEKRTETEKKVKNANISQLKKMGPRGRERWTSFIKKVQIECPSINEKDLIQLGAVLANLEVAQTQYGLIHQLRDLEPDQLDDLHRILDDWTLDMAKEVLDELQIRLELINQLIEKVSREETDEVHELQPLFQRGLWIFGPEYETIEYTSNVGMTKILHDLFNVEVMGSRNRPDFVVLPDSSIGLYSYPRYDEQGAEIGIDRLTIVELKKPTIKIGREEKDQCWKYVAELYRKGVLNGVKKVTCFILGATVDQIEAGDRLEKNGEVEIKSMLYDTVLERAKSRTLKLYDRVKQAPFLDLKEVEKYLDPEAIEQDEEMRGPAKLFQ